jgi:hypothetical protein
MPRTAAGPTVTLTITRWPGELRYAGGDKGDGAAAGVRSGGDEASQRGDEQLPCATVPIPRDLVPTLKHLLGVLEREQQQGGDDPCRSGVGAVWRPLRPFWRTFD